MRRPAAQLGIRPEHITIAEAGSGELDAKVDVTEYLGADTYVIVDAGEQGPVTVRQSGDTDLRPGDPVGLSFSPDNLHFFDAQGQAVFA